MMCHIIAPFNNNDDDDHRNVQFNHRSIDRLVFKCLLMIGQSGFSSILFFSSFIAIIHTLTHNKLIVMIESNFLLLFFHISYDWLCIRQVLIKLIDDAFLDAMMMMNPDQDFFLISFQGLKIFRSMMMIMITKIFMFTILFFFSS